MLWPVAQLVGTSSCNQKVVGLIPGQGTCLGCGSVPLFLAWMGGNRLMFLSLSSSLPTASLSPLPSSLSKISKHILWGLKRCLRVIYFGAVGSQSDETNQGWSRRLTSAHRDLCLALPQNWFRQPFRNGWECCLLSMGHRSIWDLLSSRYLWDI